MPEFRNLIVHVTTGDSKTNLREWGLKERRGDPGVSCYVQSEVGASFAISIQPKIPYVEVGDPGALSENPMEDQNQYGRTFFSEDGGRTLHDLTIPTKVGTVMSSDKIRRSRRLARLYAESRVKPPKFSFLAEMFLDGRTQPERRLIVYLNPKDPDFKQPDGKVWFKSRWVEGNDGHMREHTWVFENIGVEASFEKMIISGPDHNQEDAAFEADEVVSALNSTKLEDKKTHEVEEKNGAGQIIIKIHRVTLERKWDEHNFKAWLKEEDGEGAPRDAPNDIAHMATFSKARILRKQPIRVVSYKLWPEPPYAQFQFFYRSEAQLKLYQFPDFSLATAAHGRSKTRLTCRQRNTFLENLTPLSIKQPLAGPKSRVADLKRVENSFEDRVKAGTPPKGKGRAYDFSADFQIDAGSSASGSPTKRIYNASNASTLRLLKKGSAAGPATRNTRGDKKSNPIDLDSGSEMNSKFRPGKVKGQPSSSKTESAVTRLFGNKRHVLLDNLRAQHQYELNPASDADESANDYSEPDLTTIRPNHVGSEDEIIDGSREHQDKTGSIVERSDQMDVEENLISTRLERIQLGKRSRSPDSARTLSDDEAWVGQGESSLTNNESAEHKTGNETSRLKRDVDPENHYHELQKFGPITPHPRRLLFPTQPSGSHKGNNGPTSSKTGATERNNSRASASGRNAASKGRSSRAKKRRRKMALLPGAIQTQGQGQAPAQDSPITIEGSQK
ncbi:hypothetical protein L228DRAFT_261172 [Xylona heveae TC161]|uniref:DUF7918 domain-containing protein n=1 Tax=Xylona heveae (strain CBS 132557 / TC161) TaxID=1328760 RepID=A0A165H706_XYLHT|nr:hypothetical protein L228DRAFT_261172 [Xylona heveae TC161]KZF23072.1 hypothetical protein L228DRAFT_261172 [Xylona heveae TC161]